MPDGGRKNTLTARELAMLAMASALIFASQIAMSGLPNVELVSLLIILYTLHFERKTLFVIYTFALLEGVWYGFHLWWVMYLYVWTILYFVVRMLSGCRFRRYALLWAAVSGLFGLSFGFFCSFIYLSMGGIKVAYSWWLAGLLFDANHGLWNFVLCLVLFRPLDHVMTRLRVEKDRCSDSIKDV